MKLIKILLFASLALAGLQFQAQNSCSTANPFCATTNYTFPAGVNNGSAAAGPNYGCLTRQPNPAWYYVQISQSGPVVLYATGSGGRDVDAAAWGPFNTPTGNCNNMGAPVSCDYSTSATATITIANAQAGQYYMVLITNYGNTAQNINFTQNNANSAGAGSTNCNFTSGVTSQSICPGGTTSLVATTTLVNPTFSWTPGGQTTQTITVSPAATTAYSVSITGLPAAGGTPTTVVNTGTVTVYTTPTVVIASNTDVCPGSPIQLNATSGFGSYVWTLPPGAGTQTTTSNALSVPNANPALTGTYSVTVNSAQGCAGTGTTVVNLINTTQVTTTIPPSSCEGGTVSLTSNAPGAVSYSWTGPAGYTSNQQNPVLNGVSMGQGGVYTVTAVFTGTTGTNTCSTVATTTVTVIPASTVALTPISTVCNNGTINLSAPAGGNSYNWTGPSGFTSNLQNPVINNVEVQNQGVYSVSITASGCVRTGSLNVDVYDILSFTQVPQDITLCYGETTSLGAAESGGSSSYSYTWSPANDLSSPNAGQTLATANTTTQYTLTVEDANCPMTRPISTVVTVSVNPTPVITLGKELRGCEPYTAMLESSSNPPAANCAWLFSNNTAYSPCSAITNTNTAGLMFPVHGIYDATLSVIDVNGCTNTVTATDYVRVDPNPHADFTYAPLNPTILINEVSFYDNSSIGAPMQNWHWDFGDFSVPMGSDTANIANPSHVYDEAFTYTVSLIVTNAFGCIDTTTKYVKVEEEFAIFIPNAFTPTRNDGKNDTFYPQGIGFNPESFSMAIYDRWGNQVFRTNDITKGWDGTIKGGKAVQDVYVYKIVVTDFKKHEREFVGHVTVL